VTVTETARTAEGPVEVSVVTTAFNRGHLLPRAWASLRDETPAFEWIIVDDASTDGTPGIVESFADRRIRYIRHDVDRGGPSAGRNQGARMARGRFVVFLDDDDELYPGALARMVDRMRGADRSIGVAMFQCVLPAGRRWREKVVDGAVYDEVDVVCGRVLGLEKILIYRREIFDQFQLPEDLMFVEGEFVFAISKRYKLLMVAEPGRIYHDTGVRNTNIRGMLRVSPYIGRGYERIVRNHQEVLAGCPDSRVFYLVKAMYRYSVAGLRGDSWRVFREIARHRRPAKTGLAFAMLAVGVMGLGGLVERIRLPLAMRRRVQHAGT
jgi:glycosyltransferase involved in cell wall biosynthesis